MHALDLIQIIGTLGVIVFAASGAASANRHQLDPIGFVLIGTLTAIGGGTLRDVILNQPVFWVLDPLFLICAIVTSFVLYFLSSIDVSRTKWILWLDAAGLAAFTVQGAYTALFMQSSHIVVITMGVLTATGGGIIRDLIAGDPPIILRGQLYVSTSFLGALAIVITNILGFSIDTGAICGFFVVFLSRAAAIFFDIRMGPPGQFLKIGK